MERRSRTIQHVVIPTRANSAPNMICMDLILGIIMVAKWDNAVDKIRCYVLVEGVLESAFEVHWAGKGGHR